MHSQLAILRTTAKDCEIADKNNLLDRFERRIGSLAQLNDSWHNWVEQSILCKTEDVPVKERATQVLLRYLYWGNQIKKSKKKENLKSFYQNLADQAKKKLDAHPLTQELLNRDWVCWSNAMVIKYQRATSQIEGRNAQLSEHYFCARGIRKSHINPLTVIHNYWIKRSDHTTAAERLCDYKPPDLFEYILERMGGPPLPRNRKTRMDVLVPQTA